MVIWSSWQCVSGSKETGSENKMAAALNPVMFHTWSLDQTAFVDEMMQLQLFNIHINDSQLLPL